MKKIKLKCECGGKHYLEVTEDEGMVDFSIKGDCSGVFIWGKQIKKLRRFLKK